MDERALRAAVGALVGGRDVIVITNVVRGTGPMVTALREHGARRVLVLGTNEGTGDRPEGAATVLAPLPAATMSEEVVALEGMLDGLDAGVHQQLDAWDPDHGALVLTNPFAVGSDLGGRPVIGHRRPEWAGVEDKGTVDELLAAAGVAAPPHEVVTPDGADAAARRLAGDHGVVLAAGGRNGGAEMVRWVDPADAAATAAELVASTTWSHGAGRGRVRISPFVEGVPCSIGAVVTADGVAVLRPVENLVLRRGRTFVYAGIASSFDPAPAVRAEMDAAARRVGEELRRRVGYRGAFSVDGIVTGTDRAADGWLATEVNARPSGGFGILPIGGGLPHAVLLQVAVASGHADDVFTTAAVEATYGAAAEATRTFRLARVVPAVPPGGPTRVGVVLEPGGARSARPDEVPHGQLVIGEAATGGVALCRLTTDDAPLAIGPSSAPLAVSLLALADELWSTGTGGLTPPGR